MFSLLSISTLAISLFLPTLTLAQLPPLDKHLTDTKLPFVVHTPQGGNDASTLGLLFYLHDDKHSGPANDIEQHIIKSGPGLRLEDFAEGIVNAGGVKETTNDMTTVIPLAPEGSTSWNLDDVKEVLSFMRNSNYKFDTSKVYCAGLKMGATAIWDMVIDNPDLCSVATMFDGQPSKGANADFSALSKSGLTIQHYVGQDEATAKAVQQAIGSNTVTLQDKGAGLDLDNAFDGAWTKFMTDAPSRKTVAPGNNNTAAGSSSSSGNGNANSGDDGEFQDCDEAGNSTSTNSNSGNANVNSGSSSSSGPSSSSSNSGSSNGNGNQKKSAIRFHRVRKSPHGKKNKTAQLKKREDRFRTRRVRI